MTDLTPMRRDAPPLSGARLAAPFVVFSLPRSRSAWLSVLLGSPTAPVGHDIGPTLDAPEQFAERIAELGGACETGAQFAWRAIRSMVPKCRFAVVRRDVGSVTASLERLGITGCDQELAVRNEQLDVIASLPGTLVVSFGDLSAFEACAALHRHCTGSALSRAWFDAIEPLNIQVDLPRQMAMLANRAPQIERLKQAARAMC